MPKQVENYSLEHKNQESPLGFCCNQLSFNRYEIRYLIRNFKQIFSPYNLKIERKSSKRFSRVKFYVFGLVLSCKMVPS